MMCKEFAETIQTIVRRNNLSSRLLKDQASELKKVGIIVYDQYFLVEHTNHQ
jgi:hypothetical protein